MGKKLLLLFRFGGASVPLLLALYSVRVYAQTSETERLSRLEISGARQEERWVALAARVDTMDKTLFWLVVTTLGSGGMTTVVAADRAVFRMKQRKGNGT